MKRNENITRTDLFSSKLLIKSYDEFLELGSEPIKPL